MIKIKKIEIWSFALYAAFIAVILSVITLASNFILSNLAGASPAILNILYWNITLTQLVLTFILGFVSWLIVALLYNLVSKWTGGLKADISGKK